MGKNFTGTQLFEYYIMDSVRKMRDGEYTVSTFEYMFFTKLQERLEKYSSTHLSFD